MQSKLQKSFGSFESLEQRTVLSANLLADLNPQSQLSGNPYDLVTVGESTLFFARVDTGVKLWKSDGTTDGTVRVQTTKPSSGRDGFSLTDINATDTAIYFRAHGSIWRSDGTAEGTSHAYAGNAEIVAVSEDSLFVTEGRSHYVVRESSARPIATLEGQRPVVVAVVEGKAPDGGFIVDIRRDMHFVSNNGVLTFIGKRQAGDQLVARNDGVLLTSYEEGSALIQHFALNGGPPTTIFQGNAIVAAHAETSGRNTFIFADSNIDGNTTRSLLVTDGSSSGSITVESFSGEPRGEVDEIQSLVDDTGIWFLLETELGDELWYSDGTVAATKMVRSFANDATSPHVHSLTIGPDGQLWFIANSQSNGPQVWTSDSTESGTLAVTNFGPTDSDPNILAAVEGSVVLTVGLPETGVELWMSDTTLPGTQLIRDIYPGPANSSPTFFTQSSDSNFLFAAQSDNGRELWKTNLTNAGTVLVKDIHTGSHTASSIPTQFVEFRDRLFFVANEGIHGSEVWSTSGNADDMTLLKDVHVGNHDSRPRDLTVAGDLLYFVADDGVHGEELWQSDGTTEGTRLAADIIPGDLGSHPAFLNAVDDQLYFLARRNTTLLNATIPSFHDDFDSSTAVWKADGFEVTKHYEPSADENQLNDLNAIDDTLVFYEYNQEDSAMWVQTLTTDGTVSTLEAANFTVSSIAFEIASNGSGLAFIGGNEVSESFRSSGVWLIDESNNTAAAVAHDTASSRGITALRVFEDFAWIGDSQNQVVRLSDGETTGVGNRRFSEIASLNDAYVVLEEASADFRIILGDPLDLPTRPVASFRDIPFGFTRFDGELYFSAQEANGEYEIWKTDGTREGTLQMTNLGPRGLGSRPTDLHVFDDKLFFSATHLTHGRELFWLAQTAPAIGDINRDDLFDAGDIDALYAIIREGQGSDHHDLNRDGLLDAKDVDYLIEEVLDSKKGDANLDGKVDFTDFLLLSAAFGATEASWPQGEFSGDGKVGFEDFLLLSAAFESSS